MANQTEIYPDSFFYDTPNAADRSYCSSFKFCHFQFARKHILQNKLVTSQKVKNKTYKLLRNLDESCFFENFERSASQL